MRLLSRWNTLTCCPLQTPAECFEWQAYKSDLRHKDETGEAAKPPSPAVVSTKKKRDTHAYTYREPGHTYISRGSHINNQLHMWCVRPSPFQPHGERTERLFSHHLFELRNRGEPTGRRVHFNLISVYTIAADICAQRSCGLPFLPSSNDQSLTMGGFGFRTT